MDLEIGLFLLVQAFAVAVLTLSSIVVFAKIAPALNLVDYPGGRKMHAKPTPLVGGISLAIVILFNSLVFQELPTNSALVICGYFSIVVIGVIDDSIGLGFRIKLFIQTLGAIAIILSGLRIDLIAIDSLGISYLPVWLSAPVSVFAIVGLINAFNLIDGLDGLLASQVLVTLILGFGTTVLVNDNVAGLSWGITIFSGVFCVFVVNFLRTKIGPVFFGDCGSLALGFLIAHLLLYLTQEPVVELHPVTALWLVIYPVFDTLKVFMTRVRLKESPFSSDRKHLHYRMVDCGIGPRKTVITIGVASLVSGTLGIVVCYMVDPVISLILYCIAFWFFSLISSDGMCKHVSALERRILGRSNL